MKTTQECPTCRGAKESRRPLVDVDGDGTIYKCPDAFHNDEEAATNEAKDGYDTGESAVILFGIWLIVVLVGGALTCGILWGIR